MADDQYEQPPADDSGYVEGQEERAAPPAETGSSPPSDEQPRPPEQRQEELREVVEETHEEIVEEREEEQQQSRIWSRDQIIHEAAIKVRHLYGSPKEPVADGYYDLVDCWLVGAYSLNHEFHDQFVKRATPLPWRSRLNRYLIPYYFVFAMKGIDRAIKEKYISPIIEEKIIYTLTVKVSLPFIVAGIPLAYFDFERGPFGPTHEEAKKLADMEEKGKLPEEIEEARTRLQALKQHVQVKKEEAKQRKADYEDALELAKEKQRNGAPDFEKYKRTAENYWHEYKKAKRDYERMKERYQEVKEEEDVAAA